MTNNIKDGVFQFTPGVWTAYLGGKRIADFTSEGAARVGIEVEKRRILIRKSREKRS